MSDFPGDSQLARIVLGNQVNAISWAISVLSSTRKVAFDDVTRSLAEAETRAQFQCGFVNLEAATDYKKGLKQYMFDEGYFTLGLGDCLLLTAKGIEASKVESNKKNLATYLKLQ